MNFDDISKKLIKISKDTVTEVQKMNEVRQLGAKVSDEKKKINKIYTEIGKKLYDMYREEPLAGFETEIGGIDEGFARIDLLQAQIRSVKGVVLCPCCKMEVGIHESFCSNCGSRMPETVPIEDVEAAVVLDAGDVTETDAEETPDGETVGDAEGVSAEQEDTEAEMTSEACDEDVEVADEAGMSAEVCDEDAEVVDEAGISAEACDAEVEVADEAGMTEETFGADAEVVDEADAAQMDGVIAEEAVSEDVEAAAKLDGVSPEDAVAEDVTTEDAGQGM